MINEIKNIQRKAKYSTGVEKNIELLPDENIEFQKRCTIFTGKSIFQNPGLIILTNKRIIFLAHHFFGSDRMLFIPLNMISKINFKVFGFFRGAQRAIDLEYENESITFAITYIQKFMTGFSGSKETIDFFKLLKKKLPDNITDETEIFIKCWDYYLLLVGLGIGYIIGGILPVFICAGLGFLLGKGINNFHKSVNKKSGVE